jgi:hypothetical protein
VRCASEIVIVDAAETIDLVFLQLAVVDGVP